MQQYGVFDVPPFWSISDSKEATKTNWSHVFSAEKYAHMHVFLIRSLLILLLMLGKQTDSYRLIKRMLHQAST